MPKDQKRPGKDDRIPCKYGSKCYRKNADHLKKFKHPESKEPSGDSGTSKNAAKIDEQPHMTDVSSPKKATASRSDESAAETEVRGYNANELPDSPDNVRESIKQKFLVEMPDDFYDFWDFCCSLNKKDPSDALHDLLGLRLVGPFDVLSGKLKNRSVKASDDFLCHWRFFYDPPEMQTVLSADDESMYHIGYFRDDPEQMPVFLASNMASESCKITKLAGNLFAILSKEISKALQNCEEAQKKAKLRKLNGALVEFAEAKGHSLQEASKKRPQPQSATFHGAGLVVPYNSKTNVGYRSMPLSNSEMKRFLEKFSDNDGGGKGHHKDKLLELVTCVHIANDECDYGMGLEFSLALFCSGHTSLHRTIEMLGSLAYQLLNREPFARILKAHLKRRLKTPNVSVLD